MEYVLFITLGYFILGAIGTLLANRGKEKELKKERWIKILSYFIIVHFIILLLLIVPEAFIYLASLIVLIGIYEIVKVSQHKGHTPALITGLIIYILVSAGFLLTCMIVQAYGLIELFVLVFVFDGFSQITGQLFGKHKLLPKVSPGKTIEGLFGGLVFAIATAYLLLNGEAPTGQIIFVAAILCLSALGGDLLASYYKRIMGIKDFSRLIPGHGGVLDRFDSLITAGFAAAILIYAYFFFGPQVRI